MSDETLKTPELPEDDPSKVVGGVSFNFTTIKWSYTQQKRAADAPPLPPPSK